MLTVGPESPHEDEKTIAKGYRPWLGMVLPWAPVGVAIYSGDIKWVVASGFTVSLLLLAEAGGRFHDLCIRARRTNMWLAEISENTRTSMWHLNELAQASRPAYDESPDPEWLTDIQKNISP